MTAAIINGHIFNGESLLSDYAVIVADDAIVDVLPQTELASSIPVSHDLSGGYLVPGFIDLQVNGGGGVLFNNAPTVEGIRVIGEAHRTFGTTGFLPTLITDSFEVMRQAITAVEQAIAEGVPGVLGIHLEGPFLSAEKKGAHNAERFCQIDESGFDIMTSLPCGKTLVTIAPELTTPDMIKRLADAGVVISAGHSSASYEQACSALDAGVTGFTHLYNAMTPLQSREPGLVGAALADETSWFGIIADGHHMHPAAFKIAVAAKPQGGAILVTDAMPTVGTDDKSFVLDGETINAVNGRLVNAAGSLAGSDLDMISAVNNAVIFAGLDWLEAIRMASLYPARALGLDHQLGYIKPGYRADLVALDQHRQVTRTWINGESHASG